MLLMNSTNLEMDGGQWMRQVPSISAAVTPGQPTSRLIIHSWSLNQSLVKNSPSGSYRLIILLLVGKEITSTIAKMPAV